MFPQLYNYPYNSLQLCVPSAVCQCGSLFSLTKTRLSQRTCAGAPTSERFWHLNVTLLPETYYAGEGTVENGQRQIRFRDQAFHTGKQQIVGSDVVCMQLH